MKNYFDSQPLVSVVIATHDYAQYISEAIASILAQTYQKLEIIVVDDGSTDNTREVVQQYPQVKYVYQERKGARTPSRARNNGIALSHGEYIVALDADDRLCPEYIAKCLEAIKGDDRIGFVWTATQEFGDSCEIRVPHIMHHRLSVYRGTGGQLGAALMRRVAFNDVGGYDLALPALEDWDLAIRVIKKGWKAKPLFEVLHFVRVHEAQQTYKVKKLNLERFVEQKYPGMQLYTYLSRVFDLAVLTLSHPKTLVVRIWNKGVCRFLRCQKLPEP